MTWRDAQKDPPPYGEAVLLVWPPTRGGGPTLEIGSRSATAADGEWYALNVGDSGMDFQATHWQPLPAPPEPGS